MSFKDNKSYHIDEIADLEVKIRSGDNLNAVVSFGDIIQEMHSWIHLNGCGYRMSYNVFKFATPQQKTMFMLRWAV